MSKTMLITAIATALAVTRRKPCSALATLCTPGCAVHAGPAPGTRVVLVNVWSTWRELLVSAAERVVPVPDGVSDKEAAEAIVSPVTAWVLAMIEHRLQPGEWLTQTAAGSTVGRLVPQLARSEGFKTINIVRRRGQVPEIVELGGDIRLCTEDDDWSSQLVKAGGGGGPSKAIDCVAGRVGAALARTLAPAGRLLVYGALSSHRQTEPSAFEVPLFAPRLIYGTAAVRGWFLFHWLDMRPLSECVQAVKTVLDSLASAALRLPPATRHHPSQIGAALRDAEATARDGKPLLDFTQI